MSFMDVGAEAPICVCSGVRPPSFMDVMVAVESKAPFCIGMLDTGLSLGVGALATDIQLVLGIREFRLKIASIDSLCHHKECRRRVWHRSLLLIV
jgi:hypothetical protein